MSSPSVHQGPPVNVHDLYDYLDSLLNYMYGNCSDQQLYWYRRNITDKLTFWRDRFLRRIQNSEAHIYANDDGYEYPRRRSYGGNDGPRHRDQSRRKSQTSLRFEVHATTRSDNNDAATRHTVNAVDNPQPTIVVSPPPPSSSTSTQTVGVSEMMLSSSANGDNDIAQSELEEYDPVVTFVEDEEDIVTNVAAVTVNDAAPSACAHGTLDYMDWSQEVSNEEERAIKSSGTAAATATITVSSGKRA